MDAVEAESKEESEMTQRVLSQVLDSLPADDGQVKYRDLPTTNEVEEAQNNDRNEMEEEAPVAEPEEEEIEGQKVRQCAALRQVSVFSPDDKVFVMESLSNEVTKALIVFYKGEVRIPLALIPSSDSMRQLSL